MNHIPALEGDRWPLPRVDVYIEFEPSLAASPQLRLETLQLGRRRSCAAGHKILAHRKKIAASAFLDDYGTSESPLFQQQPDQTPTGKCQN